MSKEYITNYNVQSALPQSEGGVGSVIGAILLWSSVIGGVILLLFACWYIWDKSRKRPLIKVMRTFRDKVLRHYLL